MATQWNILWFVVCGWCQLLERACPEKSVSMDQHAPLNVDIDVGGKRQSYSLAVKMKLAQRALQLRQLWLEERQSTPPQYDRRRRKFVQPEPKWGYVARTIEENIPALRNVDHEHPARRKARAMIMRAAERLSNASEHDREKIMSAALTNRLRLPGGGRKPVQPEYRSALFSWFVDMRTSLKEGISVKLFRAKCQELHAAALAKKRLDCQPISEEEENLKFSMKWIRGWLQEYHVSLSKPHKRYAVPKGTRKHRILQLLKNVYRVRHFFLTYFQYDPVIISGDQMPFHRLPFVGPHEIETDTSQELPERASVFTQMSSVNNCPAAPPAFVFKGHGRRKSLQTPDNAELQWSETGSYRLNNMLQTIDHLPSLLEANEDMATTMKKYKIYLLDDYSVHLLPAVTDALYKKGYILIHISGGISEEVQTNYTVLHPPLKTLYRAKEQKFLARKLLENSEQDLSMSHEEMMQLFMEAYEECEVDHATAFKTSWLSNAIDGSEDHLVSAKLMELVGEEFKTYRQQLRMSEPPLTLPQLLSLLIPVGGTHKLGKKKETFSIPPDEGRELFDGDGSDIEHNDLDEFIVEEELEEVDEGIQVIMKDDPGSSDHAVVCKMEQGSHEDHPGEHDGIVERCREEEVSNGDEILTVPHEAGAFLGLGCLLGKEEEALLIKPEPEEKEDVESVEEEPPKKRLRGDSEESRNSEHSPEWTPKIRKCMDVLQKFKELLDATKASLTPEEAAPILPFLSSVQLSIIGGQTMVKTWSENECSSSDLNLDSYHR